MAAALRDLAEGRGFWHQSMTALPEYDPALLSQHAAAWRDWLTPDHAQPVLVEVYAAPGELGRIRRAVRVALMPVYQQAPFVNCPF